MQGLKFQKISILVITFLLIGTGLLPIINSDDPIIGLISSGNTLYVGGTGPGNYSTSPFQNKYVIFMDSNQMMNSKLNQSVMVNYE